MKLLLPILALLVILFTFTEASEEQPEEDLTQTIEKESDYNLKDNDAGSPCPRSHPYAYLKGDYCCMYKREKVYKPDGARCDGSLISLSSSCCRNDQFMSCPHGKCVTLKEKAGTQCPLSHPYAYLEGDYCCKVNKEGVNNREGSKCDGSVLSASSWCCGAPGGRGPGHIRCPRGKCVNAGSPCPRSHPYAYLEGDYCCMYKREKVYKPDGARCDGSLISLSSSCCRGDQFISCPHGKCVTLKEKAGTQCPLSYPYAYLEGDYCCKVNKEGVSKHEGSKCDGSVLSASSWCCGAGHTRCPRGKCGNAAVCKGVVDIGFALDSSGSLGSHYWQEKKFVKQLTESFGISKDGTHAGVVTFSEDARLSIKLNQYTTQASFENAVDGIPHLNRMTRIDLALKLAKDELFSKKNGARPNVPKLLVLLTDGSQSPGGEDPATIAADLRAAGIKMVAVGITDGVEPAELIKIVGNAKDMYKAADFKELLKPAFAKKVKKAMCTNH